MKKTLFLFCNFLCCFFSIAQKQEKVDLLIYNAKIYTINAKFLVASAMAIKNGKIEAVGAGKEFAKKYDPALSVNAKGKFIYPGFIDAHSHFSGYATGLEVANLFGTKSWDEVLSTLQVFAKNHQQGWLLGLGWDQNKWPVKTFPAKEKLDQLFPDRPVYLTRVDGHAAIANQKALDIAGVKAGDKIGGGEIVVKGGQLTGILVDNAKSLVSSKIPQPGPENLKKDLLQAQQNCFAVGLTTVSDCGLDYRRILVFDDLQKNRLLKMRIYAMLSDASDNYEFASKNGKIKTDHLTVCAFKVYADGALGSRGACLLEPYTDRPDWSGFLLSSQQHFDSVANVIYKLGFQMCTHAIGDAGNRIMLNIYAKYLKGKNDLRWRIEHAQVINENDFNFFGANSIIPSVQPTHATSDMYWAVDRLGAQRLKTAYAYKQLLNENGWIPLGTDFPVEDISPFKTFHSAVFRTDTNEYPAHGFQKENALTREQALRGMTIWAAKANFEEKEKGSLEKGKLADFIILDKDLMTIDAKDVLKTSVLATYIGGEKVYSKK